MQVVWGQISSTNTKRQILSLKPLSVQNLFEKKSEKGNPGAIRAIQFLTLYWKIKLKNMYRNSLYAFKNERKQSN